MTNETKPLENGAGDGSTPPLTTKHSDAQVAPLSRRPRKWESRESVLLSAFNEKLPSEKEKKTQKSAAAALGIRGERRRKPRGPNSAPSPEATGVHAKTTAPSEPDRKGDGSGPTPTGRADVDIYSTIEKEAKRVRATDLAIYHSEVRVLKMSKIMGLLQEAVDEAIQHSEHSWEAKERQRLLEEAEEAFQERLSAFQSEKAGLEEKTKTLQDQLNRARDLLEEERQRVVSAEQFTVSDAGILELEKRLGRLLDRATVKGGISADLESEMRTVVSQLLDDEREKIRLKAQEAQNDAISLLERKVQRLTNSLEDTESARRRAEKRASVLEAHGGFVPLNIMEAGLDEDDPDRERKLALLKEIVEGNKEVREFLAETGVVLDRRRKPRPAAAEEGPSGVSEERNLAEERESEEGPGPTDEQTVEELEVSPSLGVKKISVTRVKPPPLENVNIPQESGEEAAPGEAALALMKFTSGEVEDVDPDDLPWEPAAREE